MQEELSSVIIPANNHCKASLDTKIITEYGTSTHNTSTNIDAANNQHIANAQFDTIDAESAKTLYGGNNKKISFQIKMNNKNKKILAINEKNAIKEFLKNKNNNNNKNHLLEIKKEKSSSSLYKVFNNKFKKLYD